ncbi:ATP-binding cassette domain-containing protein [Streptomyces hyaluromycini]|uniref:ATP-binding cassette domain-containing protein n=1 Tax=Streptomyces hyaluromycini TaxID=1377993 RepID=A0ABV1X4C8_9ACTN
MSEIVTLLLLGLGSGSLVALSALGLVVTYRSSGVVNFAVGGVSMASAYLLWELTREAGWPPLAAGFLGILLGAVLGVVTYVLVMVLPRANSTLTRVIGTLAVLLVIQAVVQLRYGPDARTVGELLPGGSVTPVSGVTLPVSRIVLFGVAVALALTLGAVYTRTSFGVATTAVSERPRTLAALGWRIGMLRAGNWAVGGALAGASGVLLAPLTGASLGNAQALTVTVLAAAIVGGLRSFPLTLVGGMVIGMLQSVLSIHDLGVSGLADAVPFVAIIGVITVRGRSLPLRSFVGERLPLVGSGRISLPGLAVAVVVPVVLIGRVLNEEWTAALTTTLLAAIPLLSLTLLLGYAGQLSLTQVTLSGVGGLIAAKLAGEAGWPFPVVVLVAMLGTVPVGLVVGLPSARTRGISLAVATLGLAAAIQALVFNNESLTGGGAGIPLSADGSVLVFGVPFDTLLHPDRFAYLVLGFVVVLAVLVANLRRGATGRRMIAVRNNERAAAGLGVNVVGTKLWAFGLAAAISGLGGALAAYSVPVALFSGYPALANVAAVGYGVVGGAGSVLGAVFGSTLQPSGVGSALFDSLFGLGPVTMALVGGLLLLITIVFSPDGMATATARAVGSLRRRIPLQLPARARKKQSAELHEPGTPTTAHRVRPAALHVRSVQVAFGAVRAVDGVELHVEPGEVVGVVGANGAGKTTLIDAITGFVPSAGAIELGGQPLSAVSAYGRARAGIARSWQSLELIEDLTVLENLRVGSDARTWWSPLADMVRPKRGEPTAAVRRAVDVLDLGGHLGDMPGELSTGKRKLVALARAVAGEPSVLLLDEPCSGLDHHEREEVGKVVRSLAEEWGMAVLLIEHDVHLVRRVCDRIVALDFGRVIAEGTPDHVLSEPAVMAAYLGDVPEPTAEEVSS